jgi:hypothetical protein
MPAAKVDLPHGTWISFRDLAEDTTPEQVQEAIATRTGVVFSLDRIQITTGGGRFGDRTGAILSVEKNHLAAILQWAMGEDTINGRPVVIGFLGK